MARPLRIEYPGAVYHITARGNAREPIFLDDQDCLDFLKVLCAVIRRYNWILHAYCLMGNHYHLLIETPEGNLSKGMRQMNGIYTQRFNRRHERVGHVLQGRYKAILVEKEPYLLELCRYVVLNPVRAGIAKNPREWKWSSYRKTVGYDEGASCLTTDWVLLQFGNRRKEAADKYREFVRAGVREGSPWQDLKGQVLLGGDAFLERFDPFLAEKETIGEIPKVQRYARRPSLDALLKKDEPKRTRNQDEAICEAYVRYRYTLREIAEHLRVHYATISRAVSRVKA